MSEDARFLVLDMRIFQLPLSGSHHRLCGAKFPEEQLTTFNSLSRDHFALTTPVFFRKLHDAFNSLSRDHGSEPAHYSISDSL